MDLPESKDRIDRGPRRSFFRVLLSAIVVFSVLASVAFFFVRSESYQAGGREQGEVRFMFETGTDAFALASDLRAAGIIRSEYAFLYRLWDEESWKTLQAGEYLLSGTMTIPEIIGKLSRGETVQKGIKVTFPEGWTAVEMAARLTERGLPGSEFLELVNHPLSEWRTQFPFLTNLPQGASLEGVLFPDTYFFSPVFGAEAVVVKMLENFQAQTAEIPVFAEKTGAQWLDALTLSSILEAEVKSEEDRRMIADLFLRRLEAGMPLQSDATVRYVLGVTKVQHSLDDISIDSPYNTYKYKGLPPGPVSNPGAVSIRAVTNPTPNPYWYFLNNPETGETVFSVTFEEHVANKAKHGL